MIFFRSLALYDVIWISVEEPNYMLTVM